MFEDFEASVARLLLSIAYNEYGAERTGRSNSNFIDSGATINAVSPEFCCKAKLEDKIVDNGTTIPITLANKQEMEVQQKTVRLHLFIDEFEPYEVDFIVLPVPEEQDILLGMPWLKTVNPDIDWIEERSNREVLLLPSPAQLKQKKRKQ